MNIAGGATVDFVVEVDLDDGIPKDRGTQGVVQLSSIPEAVDQEEKRKRLDHDEKGEADTRPAVVA